MWVCCSANPDMTGRQAGEWDLSYAPQWRHVGRHLHWTKAIQSLAHQYVNEVFGLPEDEPTPPVRTFFFLFSGYRVGGSVDLATAMQWITIHVRHGDFKNWCWAAEKPEDCFAPLSVIARRVRCVFFLLVSFLYPLPPSSPSPRLPSASSQFPSLQNELTADLRV